MQNLSTDALTPAHVPGHLVWDYDVYNPGGGSSDFFLALRTLKDEAPPVFWTPRNGGHWYVTDTELTSRVLLNPESFSSSNAVVPRLPTLPGKGFIPIQLDPPEHGRYRRMLNLALSKQSVARLADGVRALTVDLIEDLKPRQGCEFVADFAFKMPILVFMRLVNLDAKDRLQLLEQVGQLIRPGTTKSEAIRNLLAYLSPIVAARRARPGEDLISWLSTQTVEGVPMTEPDLLSMCTLLLIGGLDSVANTLGFFARFLADNPGHRRQLIEQPGLIPAGVEELLRRHPTVTAGTGRLCVRATAVGDATVMPDEMIMTAPAMINFDPARYDDPMRVDFNRAGPLIGTFGRGPHVCVGANLARSELAIFLEEWLRRIPDFKVAADVEIICQPGVNIAYKSLPLVW